MNIRTLAAIAGTLLVAMPVWAQAVTVDTRLFLETYVTGKDGAIERKLAPAATVTPGDRLVYVVTYRNGSRQPVTDFVVTNPVPMHVVFAGDETAGAEMSVDGGKTWGALAALRITAANGTTRAARREDVTHLRWRIAQPIAAGGEGQVTFKARLK
jgi:uncharacterized repeat protein (TIGR01451 family)